MSMSDDMYNPYDDMDEEEYYFYQQQELHEEWEYYEHAQSQIAEAQKDNSISEE